MAYPSACPKPRAQNAKERSSMQGTILARGCMAAAAVRGDDLEPAQDMEQLIRRCPLSRLMLQAQFWTL